MHRVILVIFLAATCALLTGCSRNTPTSPNPAENRGPQVTPLTVLLLNCQADGEDIACTAMTIATSASVFVQQDVTATAKWTAVPADLTQMVAPGRFRARRTGEVVITALTQEARALLPMRFLVTPGAPPRRLGTLMVLVRDPGGAPLTEAKVEVLGGYRAGSTCTTIFGGACAIDPIVTSESFDVRATRPGYQPSTVTFRETPLGPPSATVAITLTPQ